MLGCAAYSALDPRCPNRIHPLQAYRLNLLLVKGQNMQYVYILSLFGYSMASPIQNWVLQKCRSALLTVSAPLWWMLNNFSWLFLLSRSGGCVSRRGIGKAPF